MSLKEFKATLAQKKKKILKLALRCVIPLDLTTDEQEDALVLQICDLTADGFCFDELKSEEMEALIEVIEVEDYSAYRKYLPAQTVQVGEILYGSRSFVNSARAAIIAALECGKCDVSFFLNKKLAKRGRAEAEAATAKAEAEGEVEYDEPVEPASDVKENIVAKPQSDNVLTPDNILTLAKIRELLK